MNYQLDVCGYCGACVAVCSNKVLELEEHSIIIKSGCMECGECQKVCPLGAMRGGEEVEI